MGQTFLIHPNSEQVLRAFKNVIQFNLKWDISFPETFFPFGLEKKSFILDVLRSFEYTFAAY